MRSFSKFEKQILTFMAKQAEITDKVTMVVIEKFCDAIMIEWDEQMENIKIVATKKEDVYQLRQKLFDLISLFDYLEKSSYIYLCPAKLLEDRQIYDRTKYDITPSEDGLYDVWKHISATEDKEIKAYVSISMLQERSGLGKVLQEYANSTYHVTQTLVDFVNNDFKTEEKIQFEKSMKWTKISVWIAIAIGILSTLLSCIGFDNPPCCCIRHWLISLFN